MAVMLKYTIAGRVVEISYALEKGHHVYRAPAYGLETAAINKRDAWKIFNDKLLKAVMASDRKKPNVRH